LCVNKSQFVPVIFEPPCINTLHKGDDDDDDDEEEEDDDDNDFATNVVYKNLSHTVGYSPL
jgi:hypothetical protein